MVGDLQDSIKQCNVRIIGVPEGVERENGLEGVFNEIISENFKFGWITTAKFNR